MKFVCSVLFLFATIVHAETLPGFRVEPVASAIGFVSSIVTDSHGTMYYTTTAGDIVRLHGAQSTVVAHVVTNAVGNSGLLGMALRDDNTAIVHYTTPLQTYDVVSSIDLTTGRETVIHAFVCNLFDPQFGTSAEHHGGNPIVAADGSIFVGIGDGGDPNLAQRPEWNLGKVFRIFPDGRVDQFALGVRNPFDMSWDAAKQRLIVPDNGDAADDEINIAHDGDNLGWPFTAGLQPPVTGTVAPVYVFPIVVAPTGITSLSGRNAIVKHGYVLSAFVTKALYYIANIDQPEPIAMIKKETDPIVDVTESAAGDIVFVTGKTINRLVVPQRGDCNGDGLVNADDLAALLAELADGDPHPTITAQDGSYRGSWGCDVNGDGVIDSKDIAAMKTRLSRRVRAVRSH